MSEGWFETLVEVYRPKIERQIRGYCYRVGLGDMADDIIQEAWLAVTKAASQYNPDLSSFPTWVTRRGMGIAQEIMQASKHVMAGGEKTSGVHTRALYIFIEVPLPTGEGEGCLPEVAVQFSLSDDYVEHPLWLELLWKTLTDRERTCLELMTNGEKFSYRRAAPILGVSHTMVGRMAQSIRRKALEAIRCTHRGLTPSLT